MLLSYKKHKEINKLINKYSLPLVEMKAIRNERKFIPISFIMLLELLIIRVKFKQL